MLVLTLATLFSLPTLSQEIIFLKGKAVVSNDDGKTTLKKGDIIEDGSEIITSKDSLLVLQYPSGSTLRLEEESGLKIKLPIEEEGEKLNRIRFIKGIFTMEFKRSLENEALLVKKGSYALGVRGTRFLIAQEEEDIYTSVEEGSVSVIQTKDSDEEVVNAGETLVFEEGKRLTRPGKFNWSQKLNWALAANFAASGFRNKEIKGQRLKEVKKKIGNLRKRKPKGLNPKMKMHVEKFNRVAKKIKAKVKQEIKKGNVDGQKVQKFRNKLRKRGILRRRRN